MKLNKGLEEIKNKMKTWTDAGIELAYNSGYEEGHSEGFEEGYDAGLDKIQERVDDAYGVGYRHGLDDVIDTVKWLFRNVPDKELFEGNYVEDILNLYPWEYIRAKIKEYEENQTEKSCDTCEPLKYGCNECGEEKDNWRPKQIEKSCDTCDNQNKTIGCLKHIDCQRNNFKHYEPKQTNSYRNNKYYNTFPTSKETAYKIKAEYDEETRSYTYTVDDDNDDITIDQAIYNIKRGYGIPHKHKTLALAIKALKMMKEKQND